MIYLTKIIILILQNIWSYYNNGVRGACEGLASLPENVSEWGEQAVKMVRESVK